MSKKLRAVLCGYYGKGNGGDEALLATLLQMLPENVEPIALTAIPKETSQRYGVKTCDRNSALRIYQTFQSSQAFIWGGGSLIQDVTSAASPLYYAGLMGLAQGMGLKTIAWAQGIGPLQHGTTNWLAQRCFTRCDGVSVRDEKSAALLASWGKAGVMAPDPVWALAGQEIKDLTTRSSRSSPRIAVTLRSHPLLTPQRLQNLTQGLINLQKSTGATILLIPFQPKHDLSISQAIHAQLPQVSEILILQDPRELKGIFKGVDLAIGMRLHSLIMAAAEGCRCFALSYDPKINQLMNELDLPGWNLADIPEDAEKIAQTWLEVYQEGKFLNLLEVKELSDRASLHQELLTTILG